MSHSKSNMKCDSSRASKCSKTRLQDQPLQDSREVPIVKKLTGQETQTLNSLDKCDKWITRENKQVSRQDNAKKDKVSSSRSTQQRDRDITEFPERRNLLKEFNSTQNNCFKRARANIANTSKQRQSETNHSDKGCSMDKTIKSGIGSKVKAKQQTKNTTEDAVFVSPPAKAKFLSPKSAATTESESDGESSTDSDTINMKFERYLEATIEKNKKNFKSHVIPDDDETSDDENSGISFSQYAS